MIPFATIVKPALVLLILFLFVVRLLLVAYYQQRSGDYFSNRLFYGYSKQEIGNASIRQRKAVMQRANWLYALLWCLLLLLAGLSMG